MIYQINSLIKCGVIHLNKTIYLACLTLASFFNLGCATGGTTIGWTDGGAPIVNTSQAFPLLDNRGILHEYKSDTKTYKRITHPRNDELTLYCGSHFQWETLRIVWKRSSLTNIEHREEGSYWRWTYVVTKNKKQ